QAAHLGFASFAATSPFDTDMSLGSLLKSLLLIHAWAVPAGRYWNVASWSISAEWAAYLCFPFIALIAVRLRSAAAVLFMIALTCATFAAFVHFVRFDDSVGYAIPRVATAFACGVLLQRLHSLRFAATGEALTVVALVVLIFGSVALDKVQHRSASLGYAPIVACVLVYSLACSRGPVARFLSTGAMQYGGRISYALYLVHLPVIFAAATAINRLTFSPSRATVVFGMTAAVLVCWALAHWMYTSIETHARQWLVGLLPSPARRPVLLPLEGRPDSAQ
ncbi:MAG TPA: acyltransferase, partial [Povalibacter sp.]|nr:acyltransferase [Povalibacter sp.]